ncbi:MAG: DUF3553 domain-containing protein [Phycisphaeraceae bacterium]|nr:MAG: DUF3553 domain-containing protein [Phycisphaeraceae bacterium]
MSQARFRSGDRVVHAGQPEWGVGQVVGAQSVMQNGQPTQRLTVRFERGGLRTVSTALADIRPADSVPAFAGRSGQGGGSDAGWLQELERGDTATIMRQLPEAASDPFSTLESRIRATLDLFRFTGSGGSLTDWAAVQTGLSDPLSHFTRQELESYFQQFTVERNNHLKKLAAEARRKEPEILRRMAAGAPPEAQQVLRRADG